MRAKPKGAKQKPALTATTIESIGKLLARTPYSPDTALALAYLHELHTFCTSPQYLEKAAAMSRMVQACKKARRAKAVQS